MSVSTASHDDAIVVRFSRTITRHIKVVSHTVNERLVAQCTAAGHAGLKAVFFPILFRIGAQGARAVDIAELHGMAPQAMWQIVNEIVELGYLLRRADPRDKRAKQLVLSARGKKLLADVGRLSVRIDAELAAIVGSDGLDDFKHSCSELARQFAAAETLVPVEEMGPYPFSLYLSGIISYCEQELNAMNVRKGYINPKMSFTQIIVYTSPYGSSINDLARINGVSKQAISKTVKELEALGYVERRDNASDARSTKVYLTDSCLRLIEDSYANVEVMKGRIAAILGEKKYKRFAVVAEKLHDHFNTLRAHGDASEQVQTTAVLRHFVERLYSEKADDTRLRIFSRSGNKVSLSAAALKILAELAIKPAD